MEKTILSVLDFWFPNESFQDFWFSSEYDSKITLEYHDVWNHIKNMSVEELSAYIDNHSDNHKDMKNLFLGIIIILDQFTRNILRSDDRSKYEQTDTLCIDFIKSILIKIMTDENKIFINTYPINQRIFLLLPFRHQRKTGYLDYVMGMIKMMDSEVDEYTNINRKITMKNIISRFRIATIKDYSKVTDTIVHMKNEQKYNQYIHYNFHNQYLSEKESMKEIFTPNKIKQKLYHVLDDYCIDNYSFKPIKYSDIIKTKKLYHDTLKFLKNHNIKDVCISLSGGVDSMVLSIILRVLKREKEINNLCAVHVDYGNREISFEEASFVANWCTYFSIPLITRRIEHMKRNGTTVITENVDRILYETETRNIRFNLYREAMRIYNVKAVMLGHHCDDLSENVLMNVLRGGDVLNLFTMHEYQMIDGIPISRPMLGLPKSEIFEFAHLLEIPYVKDVTPENCFRGTIRKIVIPALQKIDPAVLSKVNKIGESSDRWEKIVNTQIIRPIIDSVVKYKYGLILPFKTTFIQLDIEIWKKVLSEIFHTNKIKMISHKNLYTFMRWLNTRNGIIRLSNGYTVTIYNEYLIIIQTDILYKTQELASNNIIIDGPTNVNYNGWLIKIQKYTGQQNITDTLTIDKLMEGNFQYVYNTCVHSIENIKLRSTKKDTYCSGIITYLLGHRDSDTRKFFKGIAISQYIPMIHFGICCNKCKKILKDTEHNNIIYYYLTVFFFQILTFLNIYNIQQKPIDSKKIEYLISYTYLDR